MKTNKKVEKRYHGITKVKRGTKMCWLAKEDKNGWALALSLSNRDVWLTGLRFATKREIVKVILDSRVIFVHTKNSKTVPKE